MFLKIRLRSHIIASQICRETEPETPLLNLLSTQFCSKYKFYGVLRLSQLYFLQLVKINLSFLPGSTGDKEREIKYL